MRRYGKRKSHPEKKETNRSEAGGKRERGEGDSDPFKNIIYQWKNSDRLKRGERKYAWAAFYYFFRYVTDPAFFVEIAKQTWPGKSEIFQRFIYAKLGGKPEDDFEEIVERFYASKQTVTNAVARLLPAEHANAPMSPPRYIASELVERRLAADPEDGIWLNPHNHHSIPFVGRMDERKALTRFIESPAPFLVLPVVGASGAGKTRLVSEWMKPYASAVSATDWDAGFVTSRDPLPWCGSSADDGWSIARNTIIVFDETFGFGTVLSEIAKRAREQSDFKVRVLVLDAGFPKHRRDIISDPFWGVLFRDQLDFDLLSDCVHPPLNLKPLSVEADAAQLALYAAGGTTSQSEIQQALAAVAERSDLTPLSALLYGRSLQNTQSADSYSLEALIQYFILNSSRLSWRNEYSDQDKAWAGLDGEFPSLLIAIATMLDGLDLGALAALLPEGIEKKQSSLNQLF